MGTFIYKRPKHKRESPVCGLATNGAYLFLSWSVSRVLSCTVIYLRITLPLSPSVILVKRLGETPYNKRFVKLASGGVYIAPYVTVRAVGSYPAFSTLPINRR